MRVESASRNQQLEEEIQEGETRYREKKAQDTESAWGHVACQPTLSQRECWTPGTPWIDTAYKAEDQVNFGSEDCDRPDFRRVIVGDCKVLLMINCLKCFSGLKNSTFYKRSCYTTL